MRRLGFAAGAALAILWAVPAMADVKAGVDAWARGEYRKAVDMWRVDAAHGDADAAFNLGQAYRLGRGVPVDLKVAEGWYKKAADQGHVEAETNYGLALFDDGHREEALPWLQKGASRGEPRAQMALGTMLYNGDGVARDFPRAYALIVRASSSGLPRAAEVQGQMDQFIPLPDRQRGLELARQYEADAKRPQLPAEGPQRQAMQVNDQSPAALDETRPPVVAKVSKLAREKRAVVGAQAPAPPAARSAPAPRPAPVAVASGGWRLQLGAFGDPANARRLWSQVGGRFGGKQASFARAGAVTRVLVGPYSSRAAAVGACGGVSPCVPVAP